jgi:hypothetical protein
MAKLINESIDTCEQVATAIDPRTIVVQIPAEEKDRPDTFISSVLNLNLPAGCIRRPRPPELAELVPVDAGTVLAQLATSSTGQASAVPFLAKPQNKYWNLGLWWVGGCLLMNGITRLYSKRKQSAISSN